MGTHYVKVKLAGKGRYDFLKSNGSTTHLTIHANTWTEDQAKEIAVHIVADNPGVVEAAKAVAV